MNILHISPYVPSVHASHAGGVCMGKELEALRKKHNVYVLSFINDEKEEKELLRILGKVRAHIKEIDDR